MIPTHVIDPNTRIDDPDIIHGLVDSNWGGDWNHHQSIIGIIIKYAGGTIYFKTNFQETIAMSAIKAEITTTCNAGKAVLYIRSILIFSG